MTTKNEWEKWAYGKTVSEMSKLEIERHFWRAWDTNNGEEIRRFRAEAERRGFRL